jgi:predicted O-methyltransferase YrrM
MVQILGLDAALNIDGWMSPEELTFLGENATEATSALQIGCYKGRSSFVIGMNIKGQLLDIDSFVGDKGNTLGPAELFEVYRSNVNEMLGKKIKLVMGSSNEVLPILNRSFDMIFVDGSHIYEDVKRDITLCLPLLKPGGLLCGHDYTGYLDVKRAVDELLCNKAQLYPNTSIWYLRARERTFIEEILAKFTTGESAKRYI